ncbi:hypothetical protein HY522_05245 [bacterium]|nr:hypothetical protein [bacterium]
MDAWWGSLSSELRIFYSIAIVSSAVLLIQLLLLLIGLDHSLDAGDMDMGGPGEHPGGLHILSVRSVVAFFVGFGWTGVVALNRGLSTLSSVFLAGAVGAAFLLTVYYMMKSLHGLRSSGTLDYKNAVGQIATVYLPIPAERGGPGQIEVMIQGRVMVVQAFTKSSKPIGNRAKVRVVEQLDAGTLLVEPIAD